MAKIFVHQRTELLGPLLGDAESFGGIARGGKSAGDFDWHVPILARSLTERLEINLSAARYVGFDRGKAHVGQDRGIPPFEMRERWGTRQWLSNGKIRSLEAI